MAENTEVSTVGVETESNNFSFSMRPRIKELFNARVEAGEKTSKLINEALCVYFGVDPAEYMVIQRSAKYESEEAKVVAHTLKKLNSNPAARALVMAALAGMGTGESEDDES